MDGRGMPTTGGAKNHVTHSLLPEAQGPHIRTQPSSPDRVGRLTNGREHRRCFNDWHVHSRKTGGATMMVQSEPTGRSES